MGHKIQRPILDTETYPGWVVIRGAGVIPVFVRYRLPYGPFRPPAPVEEVDRLVQNLGLEPSPLRRAAVEAAFIAGEVLAGVRILIEE